MKMLTELVIAYYKRFRRYLIILIPPQVREKLRPFKLPADACNLNNKYIDLIRKYSEEHDGYNKLIIWNKRKIILQSKVPYFTLCLPLLVRGKFCLNSCSGCHCSQSSTIVVFF